MIGNQDAPAVLIRTSTNLDSKDPLDVSDRLISFDYVDTESGADVCHIELDNFDLSLYDREELRAGSQLFVSWGYAGALSPVRSLVIKRSNASNTKPVKGAKKRKFQTSSSEKGVSKSDSGGETEKGVDVFKIEAYDTSILMHQNTKSRVFENMTRSAVVQRIAQENGFSPAFQFIDDTSESYEVITQAKLTDAQFLKRLAAKEGFEWFIDWDGFHFHKRKLGQPPARVFRYFTDPSVVGPVQVGSGQILKLDEIDANLTARPGGVTVAGFDPLRKKEIKERSTNADTSNRAVLAPSIELIDAESSTTRLERRNVAEHVISTPQATKDSARREADGRYRKAQQNSVKLKFTVEGDAHILAKSVIEVQGIGPLFSGYYYISEARHRYNDSGYLTSIACRRDGVNKGPQSKGALNRQPPAKDGVTPFEAINPETGKTQTQWRDSKGRVIAVENPETQSTELVTK